jgi:hypothetical protein
LYLRYLKECQILQQHPFSAHFPSQHIEWFHILLLTKLLFFFRSASPYLCDHKIKKLHVYLIRFYCNKNNSPSLIRHVMWMPPCTIGLKRSVTKISQLVNQFYWQNRRNSLQNLETGTLAIWKMSNLAATSFFGSFPISTLWMISYFVSSDFAFPFRVGVAILVWPYYQTLHVYLIIFYCLWIPGQNH